MNRPPLCMLAVALLLTACEPSGRSDAPVIGEFAPAYAVTTPGGEPVSLAGLGGRPVLLNVWATWCHPCREEIPVLQALRERYADEGLQVVGISVDGHGAADAVRRFARGGG